VCVCVPRFFEICFGVLYIVRNEHNFELIYVGDSTFLQDFIEEDLVISTYFNVIGVVVTYILAMDMPGVRFPDDVNSFSIY
jgi:hypothetical protein